MQLEIHDLAEHGVIASGPSSAGFNSRLTSLVSVPGELADAAPKYSVILENQTPQHIIGIAVVWRFYPSQGSPIEHVSTFSFLGNPYPDRRERMRSPQYIYARVKHQTAQQALARHKNFGGDQGLIDWIRQSSRGQIVLTRR